ncbi:cation:proton antiporter [Micromonospora yasonensis]|uniref:cation:proton antiporter domain-containing protein n=1 Tax=Micromonospora yasonensis TaxID=1128667 RepID=UPI00222E24FE|nr:cation:proton antiporter [Micromonospora yasonensis]MCW3841154.1 cation:proton antiporter [Micromonospora yasonensis]
MAGLAHLFVAGATLAAVGAAVAPSDPVAALAVGRRVNLPPKLVTIIQGEGLLNDATALTILSVAVTAAVSGTFSFPAAAGQFVLAAAGGLVVGAVIAWVFVWRGTRPARAGFTRNGRQIRPRRYRRLGACLRRGRRRPGLAADARRGPGRAPRLAPPNAAGPRDLWIPGPSSNRGQGGA